MILIWNDVKAFQQHLEDMRTFRQSHDDIQQGKSALFKNMPTPYDVNFPCNTGGGKQAIKNSGKTIIVPIWKITAPTGSQN